VAIIFADFETVSTCRIKACGSHNYVRDPSTDMLCLCYVIDGDDVPQVCRPGDAVPTCFADPANTVEWWNWFFDSDVYAEIAVARYNFPAIPLERQICIQRVALANGYPAELGLCCHALDIPYTKDKEAAAALRRLNSPPKKTYDAAMRERDEKLVIKRCMTDVLMLRAISTHPRIRPLAPREHKVLLVDAEINVIGITANVPLLQASYNFAKQCQKAAGKRLSALTGGAVVTVNQCEKIIAAVNARGHGMTKLTKRAVAAVLANKPDPIVREILELRRNNAHNSVLKFKKLIDYSDSSDHRIRNALRFCGAHTGRWTSSPQLHNLNRNDNELPRSLVAALLAGNIAELERFGNPLHVVAQIGRAVLRAADGCELICPDFSNVEGRILMWLAGEDWELENFRNYDATGDGNLDPYKVTAHRILRLDGPVSEVAPAQRQIGKFASLALGYGGSIGAWRNIAKDEDVRSDTEILDLVHAWRTLHPNVCRILKQLGRIARAAIRTSASTALTATTGATIVADFDGYALSLRLPSGRKLYYPGARLVPNNKFEDGDPDVEYLDNSKGGWKYKRAWYGIFAENVVSGIARDLLAAAILRAHERGFRIVHHCHDEIVIEAPRGTVDPKHVLALMLEKPAWAARLPLNGKVHVGELYLDGPETGEPRPGTVIQPDLDDGSEEDDTFGADEESRTDAPETPVETGSCVELAAELPDGPTLAPQESPKFSNDFDELPDLTTAHANEIAAHICSFCHRDPPDGHERASAYGGVYLHPQCETLFIQARVREEGIATAEPPPRETATPPKHTPPCLATALDYAARGWHVFPAPPDGSKKSLKSAKFSNGRAWGMTTDPDEIARDYRRWPDANIGIATGAISGVFVVEADTKEGHEIDGIASLRALEARHGALPPTLTAISPSGSLHWYFRQPADIAINNTTSKLAPGVDVRGDGGMVLAPPSLRPGKGAYVWTSELAPTDAPSWLIELVTKNESEHVANETLLAEDIDEIAAAVAAIPSIASLGWDGWNRIAMAIYGATDGSEEGFAIFDAFSQRCAEKYDAPGARDRWDKLHSCPPNRIGAGTLFYLADQHDPRWRERYADDVVRSIQLDGDGLSGGAFVSVETGRVYGRDSDKSGTSSGGNGRADAGQGSQQGQGSRSQPAPYVLRNLHEVTLRASQWLWPGHLPASALEMTSGGLGLGKGLLACDLAARVTTGRPWPNGSPGEEPGTVIVISAEDNAEDFKRRFRAADADETKVKILDCVLHEGRAEPFLVARDMDKLARMCRDLGDVRLVILDPITAFMGSGKGFDSHRASDVRTQRTPLKMHAEKLGITVSAITHPTKNAAAHAVVDNFIGSQAFIATARVGHYCIEELGEEDERGFRRPTGRVLYAHARRPSHSALMPTLVFRQEIICVGRDPGTGAEIRVPRLAWEQAPVDLTADEALAQNKPKHGDGRKARAAPVREFLRDTLAAGPMLRETVIERGEIEGFGDQQLRRAREAIGAVAYRQHKNQFGSPTYWCLPEHAPANVDITDG
jgi:hypothetical protein